MRTKLLLAALAVALLVVGAGAAYILVGRNPPEGKLDTVVAGVSLVTPTGGVSDTVVTTAPAETTLPTETETETEPATTSTPSEGPCWLEFGGDPQRSLSRPDLDLGIPAKKPVWVRGMGSYMEYPPSFCDGTLYVNTFGGRTAALDAETGRILWSRQDSGRKPSTPAIAGDRLIVSSVDGSVTALNRDNGRVSGVFRPTPRSSRLRWPSTIRRTSVRRMDACSRSTSCRGTFAGRTTPADASTPARRSGATGSASRPMPGRSSVCDVRTGRSSGARTSSGTRSSTKASTQARRPMASGSTRCLAGARSSR